MIIKNITGNHKQNGANCSYCMRAASKALPSDKFYRYIISNLIRRDQILSPEQLIVCRPLFALDWGVWRARLPSVCMQCLPIHSVYMHAHHDVCRNVESIIIIDVDTRVTSLWRCQCNNIILMHGGNFYQIPVYHNITYRRIQRMDFGLEAANTASTALAAAKGTREVGERERGIIAYQRVLQSHISNRGYIMIIIIHALYKINVTWRYL